ncbi:MULTISPECIES: FkbM family methyltransferase [unclassified Pseudomonas]|uniref:FkbM family methyltransferase n=1 Tax=unclassified Pseudomonas TaxID=196821 RepID=UPI00244A8BF6|nr:MULTISPECIES: FkbM family methyltransferase [unclassified Pseudomonas]MDG9925183.1 FkbM family methyltransferase [Pseudomonas sp. GD04045]MDH0035313.1 FkbM family methyltransferase [Pseudomonas sp. GD04019]
MTFISYAQNFEDVTLWRALKLTGPGWYIDVGANHPNLDSVTRSFYERGWRGINIEPVEHYYDALCEARPDEINLCVAVAPEAGELRFYENRETGLSTLSEDMREVHEGIGIQFVPRTVQTRRLDSICEEYMPSDVPLHFLKIDVEGFERQVLESMDFTRWRPWIVVLESAFDKHPDWEDLLMAAGYLYASCDGINRYFVAKEQARLIDPLSMFPCVLDEFRLCPGHLLSSSAQEVEVLRADLQQAEQRARQAEQQLSALQASRSWRLLRCLAHWKARFGGRALA